MNTTELIELLKSVEFSAGGRPREISISFNSEGMFFPNPKLNIAGTGDLVNHPSHYQGLKGLEVREVMENFVPKYGQYGGLVSCDIKDAIKYILRAPDKNGLEDLQKAQRMIKYAIDSLTVEE